MAVTGTYTVREIVEEAFRVAGIVADDEPMTADQQVNGIRALNMMLKGWQNQEWGTWLYASGTLTLTTDADYALDPVRPLRIVTARLRRSGIETPMSQMTRQEYDDLPLKSSTGLPTQFYYDRNKEAARFYVWPVLAVAGGETVEYTYEREIEDIAGGSDVIDVPGEWWEATVYQLAVRLAPRYGVALPAEVGAIAVSSLDAAQSADREGSVFFCDG